jgi:hypothetical protein
MIVKIKAFREKIILGTTVDVLSYFKGDEMEPDLSLYSRSEDYIRVLIQWLYMFES